MNQEGAFFPPQDRKSFCSSGCNHHGYRDCVSTQTEDTGYCPWFDSFYWKMKFLSRKAPILWQQWRPTAAAKARKSVECQGGKSGNTVRLSRLEEEVLSKWSQEDVGVTTWTDSDTWVSPCPTLKHQGRPSLTITTTATTVQSRPLGTIRLEKCRMRLSATIVPAIKPPFTPPPSSVW